ncbi:MAG TPA: cadherin-like beta sandwich domain-containing protein, partial [Fibrobacteria bacterium]|nr:cadherin-like beta sandwich domain-containing protein [Fibrobacteria bacterium]
MKTMHRISVSMLLGFSVLLLSCQDQNAVDAGSASAPVSLSPRLLTAPTDTATFGRTVLVRARATAGAVMDSAWVPFDSGHYVFGSLPPNTAYTLSFQGFLADSATLLWTATHTGNTGTASTTVDLPVVIAATPLFSTAGGSFTTPQTITIAANGADSIEISRDGRNWTAYTPPLIDSTSGKLYARSFKGGLAVDTTTITLSIDLPAHDSTLKALSVSGQTLTPSFASGVLSYTTDSMVTSATSAVILDTANASGATVTCNSGSCGSVSLSGANTAVSVKVANGSSSLTYTVDILRKQTVGAVAHDTTLKNLSVSGQTLTPSFTPGVLSYTTDSMSSGATSAVILDTANASGATVTCNSGSCGSVSLAGASTVVSVNVVNGSSSLTYAVDILRKQAAATVAHDTTLKALSVVGQTLTPSFAPSGLSYTTDSMVTSATSAVILDTANVSGATVTCNGSACGSVSLSGANTAVSVKVVNGSSSLTYTVDILRKQTV